MLVAATSTAAAAQADSAQHTETTYTASQAERGRAVFRQACASCHVASQHASEAFRRAWAGRPAVELFELIRTTMPNDNPGRLRRQEYADVLAYILNLNGVPAGSTELPPDTAALRAVRFPPSPDSRP